MIPPPPLPALLQVEAAFKDMQAGKRDAMSQYNAKQVSQLTKLIDGTRMELKKEDRQKIMNMITIDAHSRDMVLSIAEAGVDKEDCFQWVCQLRTYWDENIQDCRVRICDASFPYGYEYLGNGARLVITPLTDRIYITATQVRGRGGGEGGLAGMSGVVVGPINRSDQASAHATTA